MPDRKDRKIKIQKPHLEYPNEEAMWDDVRRYAKMIPSEPDPNMGRVQEIKEEIRKGTYLTRDMIDETAAILSIKFVKGETDSCLEDEEL